MLQRAASDFRTLISSGLFHAQGVYFLEKYDELCKLVDFDQKLRYFTGQNGLKGEPHENEFSNSEMNVTSSRKSR